MPAGPLQHILINILFYHSGHPAIFEHFSYLNSKNTLFYTHNSFSFLNKFRNFVYEVTDALHKSFFPLALKAL
jgi:hypothetical protein